jgi:hypothetical protein
MKLTLLKGVAIAVEATVVISLAAASYYVAFAGKDGIPWLAAAPLVTIVALETVRIPVALNLVKASLFTTILSVALIVGISLITMEAASVSFETLIFERTRPVVEAERDLEKIMVGQKTIDANAKDRADKIVRLTADLDAARKHREEVGSQKPELAKVGDVKTCYRVVGKGKKARQQAYDCTPPSTLDTAKGNRGAQDAHNDELKSASDQVVSAERRLADEEAIKFDTHVTDEIRDEASRKVKEARAMNPMFRVAAAWQKVPVQDLTSEQFEYVKHWAIMALAFGCAFVTSILAVISSMPERGQSNSKLVRAIRARLAAKRKTLRRFKERVITEIKKEVKLVYVPVDATTGKVLDPAFQGQGKPDLKVVS